MTLTTYADIIGMRKYGKRRQNADIDAKTGQYDHTVNSGVRRDLSLSEHTQRTEIPWLRCRLT